MASIFGHGITAIAICAGVKDLKFRKGLVVLGMISSILPDADVLGFFYGVPYESFWGHRGFTHSIVFAAFWTAILVILFYRKRSNREIAVAFLILFLCTCSHGVLDMMTSGGRGVALFSPVHNERLFLPWRPIVVSPIGASNFFSMWGLKVLISEAIWIGIPALTWFFIVRMARRTLSSA